MHDLLKYGNNIYFMITMFEVFFDEISFSYIIFNYFQLFTYQNSGANSQFKLCRKPIVQTNKLAEPHLSINYDQDIITAMAKEEKKFVF